MSKFNLNQECVAEMHKLAPNISHERFDGSDQSQTVEDVMVQCKLLEARNTEMVKSRTKIEEENGFIKHQLKQRDRRMEASAAIIAKHESTITQLQRLVDEKDKMLSQQKYSKHDLLNRIDMLTAENLQLRSSQEHSRSHSASWSTMKKVDQYSQVLEHKIKCVTLRRRLREARGALMDTMAKGEAMAMEVEDHRAYIDDLLAKNGGNSVVNLKVFARRASGAMGPEADEGPTEQDTANMDSYYKSTNRPKVFGASRGDMAPHHYSADGFPAQPLELSTRAEIEFQTNKYRQSSFGHLFKEMDAEMTLIATRAKDAHDKNQNALLHVLYESTRRGGCVLANPRQDYTAQLASGLRDYNKATRELLKAFRDNSVKLINFERTVKEKLEAEIRASLQHNKVTVGTQANFEDPEMAELSEKVAFLEQGQQDAQQRYFAEISKLEDSRAKAEINEQYLQSKVFELHEAIHDTLSAVHRHRFQWIGAVPNTFNELIPSGHDHSPPKSKAATSIHYNLRIGGAIDEDRKLLGKFAHYFLSKELFGTVVQGTLPPTGQAKGSASANSDGLGEYQRNTAARSRMTQQKQTAKNTLEAAQRLLKKEERFEKKVAARKSDPLVRRVSSSVKSVSASGTPVTTPRSRSLTEVAAVQGLDSLGTPIHAESNHMTDFRDSSDESEYATSLQSAEEPMTNDKMTKITLEEAKSGYGNQGPSSMNKPSLAQQGYPESAETCAQLPSYRIPSAPISHRPSIVDKTSPTDSAQSVSTLVNNQTSSRESKVQGIIGPVQPSTPVGAPRTGTIAPRRRASTFTHITAASATNKGIAAPTVAATRPSSPTQGFAFPLPHHSAPSVLDAPAASAPTLQQTASYSRMELWQKQQQDQWERRRQASLGGVAPTIVYVTSAASINNENALATGSASTIDASKWMGSLSRHQNLTYSSSGTTSTLPQIGGTLCNGSQSKDTSQPLAPRRVNVAK